MYFLYGVIESIGHLSEDEKRIRMRAERTSSTTSTISVRSTNSNHIPNHTNEVPSEVTAKQNSDQNQSQNTNCDKIIKSETIGENSRLNSDNNVVVS